MKKSKIFILVCIISIMCGACKNGIEADNNCEEADKTTSVTTDVVESDTELSFSNLIMTVICDYPESENCNVYYLVCVMNNGSVYSMNYELTNKGSAYGGFMDKLYYCDENIWNEADDIKLIGKLPENKASLLKENIINVNRESDYYSIGKEPGALTPDVVETIYYSAYCYPSENSKDKRAFCVKKWGKETGCSYNTYDESANAILDAVLEDELYEEWKKQHISNLYE